MQDVISQCNRIAKIVPLSKDINQNSKDRSLIFKAVVLSRLVLSEHWLADSLEAVRSHPAAANKPGYFHGVLKSKCKEMGFNFNRLLKRVVVPDRIVRPSA